MVGRYLCFKRYLSVFQQGHECSGLDDRSRFARSCNRKVVRFIQPSFTVPGKIDHGSDGSGAHFHKYKAASIDFRLILYLSPQRLVGDVLKVNVQGGSYVASVNNCYSGTIGVHDLALVVGASEPLKSRRSMQLIVKLALDTSSSGLVHILLFADISDHASCKTLVRILSWVKLFCNESTLVLALVEKRQFFQLEVCQVVNLLRYEQITVFLFSSLREHLLVVLLALALFHQHFRKNFCETHGLFVPGLLSLLRFRLHRAVHIYII